MRNEKLMEVPVSYFLLADDYTVVMETYVMKHGTKKIQRRATEVKTVNRVVPCFQSHTRRWINVNGRCFDNE